MFVPSALRGIKASSAVYVLIAAISASLSVGHAAEQCSSDAVKAGGCKDLRGLDCEEILVKETIVKLVRFLRHVLHWVLNRTGTMDTFVVLTRPIHKGPSLGEVIGRRTLCCTG